MSSATTASFFRPCPSCHQLGGNRLEYVGETLSRQVFGLVQQQPDRAARFIVLEPLFQDAQRCQGSIPTSPEPLRRTSGDQALKDRAPTDCRLGVRKGVV